MFHENRDPAVGVRAHDDVFDIGGRTDVAAAADHVLAAGKFNEAPADVVVPRADRFHDALDGNAVGEEGVGVEVDLVLPDKPADGGNFGNAGDGLQLKAQIPVLERAQFSQTARSRGIHQRILEHPANGGLIPPQLDLHPLGQLWKDGAEDIRSFATWPSKCPCRLQR